MVNATTTNYIPIKKFSYSSYGLLSYALAELEGPLWLSALSVQRVAGEGVVSGSISQGEKGKPGRANLQVSREIYDALLAVSTSPGSHAVQLTFDQETFAPLAIAVS